MKKTLVAVACAAASMAAAQPASAAFKLEITEIWSGNFAAPDATKDWFEVTNTGNTAWTPASGNIYYDDESVDPVASVQLQGITSIGPGQTVIFVDGGTAGASGFTGFWGALLPPGLQVGNFTNNSSALSNAGDTVALWVSAAHPIAGQLPTVTATYPNSVGFRGASFDTRLRAFSSIGNAASAFEKDSPAFPGNADSTVASPGFVQSSSSGVAGVDLQVTEIWPGNDVSPDSTDDWFEITNMGNTAYNAAINGNLYYDDNSNSAAASVQLQGITTIAPHESVYFTELADVGAPEFKDFWEPRVGHALKVGTFQGSALSLSGTNGDTVNIWMSPTPPTGSVPPTTSASFPAGSHGASRDVQLGAFSLTGATGVITVPRANLPPEPTTASPGLLPPVPTVPLPGILWLAPALAGLGALGLRGRKPRALRG